MKLRISHLSRYEYAQDVAFSSHRLYLRPREQSGVQVHEFLLNVNPNAKVVWTRDVADNPVGMAWFWDHARALSIRSEFIAETSEANPFDFILHEHATRFPFSYTSAEAFALSPFLAPPFEQTQRGLSNWLDEHLTDRPEDTVSFLSSLNSLLHDSLQYVRREERGIQPSLRTLQLGSGSCRDYAVLLIELCRSLGLAARFVSGYMHDVSDNKSTPDEETIARNTMHAWIEIYLPGAGWKGLDPTHGMWCNDAFVPVAVAAQADTINPIQGAYYASVSVSSQLTTAISIERLDVSKPA